MNSLKIMSVKEFRAEGFLQELNRQFMHPLGLALSVHISEHGDETLGDIHDYREDPDGIIFTGLDAEETKAKELRVCQELWRHMPQRDAKFGWVIQPVATMIGPPDPANGLISTVAYVKTPDEGGDRDGP